MSAEGVNIRDLRQFRDLELVGDKVRLRPVRRDDAPAAFTLVSDDLITRNFLWDGPSSVEDVAIAFEAMGLPGDGGGDAGYTFAIEAVTRTGIIGCIVALSRQHPRQFDIGYWLGVPHWGAA